MADLGDYRLNNRYLQRPDQTPGNGHVLTFNSTTQKWESAPPAGGSGAPLGAQYITLANDASLTAERQLVIGTGLTGVDTGANGNYTIALSTPVSPSNLGTGSPSSLNFLSGDGTWKTVPVPSHSALSNLSADDHPQYHTDARGDARYYTQAITDNRVATARFLAGPITQIMTASASYTYEIALTQSDWTNGWVHIRCNDTLPLGSGSISGDFSGVGSTFEFTATSTDAVGRVAAWQAQTSYPSSYAVCMMHPSIWYRSVTATSPAFMGFSSATITSATLAVPYIGISDVFLYPGGAGNVLRIVFKNTTGSSQTLRCTMVGRVFKNVSQTA
ncbi:MAG: hypothetical protein K2X01_11995 [Cyanobacteria bacterium]|nr:hypothetical protein [Cyanobacteriota bacterium]